MVLFFVYGLAGYTLAINSATWQVVGVGMGVGIAWAMVLTFAVGPVSVSNEYLVEGKEYVVLLYVLFKVFCVGFSALGNLAVPWAMAWAMAWAIAGVIAGAVTGAITMVVEVVVAWLIYETSMFDQWKNADWFDNATLIIFMVLPAGISAVILGIWSQNFLLGTGIGVGSIVICFVQGVAAIVAVDDSKDFSSFNKDFNVFSIFASANLSGLGGGWLLGFLLHSKS